MNKSVSIDEVHLEAPEGFTPKVHVSGCYLEIDQKILLLQTREGKSEPGKWGVPAGKIEANETPLEAARRELFEETGITDALFTEITHLHALYIRKPHVDYVYHLFKVHLTQKPEISLSNEHQGYHWASVQDTEEMSLMAGAREAIRIYRAAQKEE